MTDLTAMAEARRKAKGATEAARLRAMDINIQAKADEQAALMAELRDKEQALKPLRQRVVDIGKELAELKQARKDAEPEAPPASTPPPAPSIVPDA